MVNYAWVNGSEIQCVALEDRGLMYGDGFFTTMRVTKGLAVNWTAHWARLTAAVERLGFPEETVECMRSGIAPAMPALSDGFTGVMKIIVTRGVGPRGYLPPKDAVPTVIVQLFAKEKLPPLSDMSAPLTVSLSPVQAFVNPHLAGVKHLNVLPYVLAARRLPEGHREALMLDDKDQLVGGIQANVVMCVGRTIYTPVIDRAGVAGTTLETFREVAIASKYQWRETTIHKAELMKMEALAFLNAYLGLQPVREVDSSFSCCFDPEKWRNLVDNLNEALNASAQPPTF